MYVNKDHHFGDTHCSVGTIPLTDGVPLGVAAGVAGVATGPDDCSSPCWPLFAFWLSISEDGGVRSPAPPGNDKDAGLVKAFACRAFCGWEMMADMTVDEPTRAVGRG